jgi:hypothetical protein
VKQTIHIPTSSEAKETRIYTSTPSIRLHGAVLNLLSTGKSFNTIYKLRNLKTYGSAHPAYQISRQIVYRSLYQNTKLLRQPDERSNDDVRNTASRSRSSQHEAFYVRCLCACHSLRKSGMDIMPLDNNNNSVALVRERTIPTE